MDSRMVVDRRRRILVLLSWTGLVLGGIHDAVGQPQVRGVRIRYRNQVQSDGATKPDLKRQLGIKSMTGIAWGVELMLGPNQFRRVKSSRVFYTGDRFRIRVEPLNRLFIYVVVRNADGTQALLYPGGDHSGRLQAEAKQFVPATKAFLFQGTAGEERIRIVASPRSLASLTAGQLFSLRNGDIVPEAGRIDLASLVAARKQRGGYQVISSLQLAGDKRAAAAPGLSVITPLDIDNIAAVGSYDGPPPILVRDLTLVHRKQH